MAETKQKITGDSSAAVKELDKLKKKNEALNRALKETKAQAKSAESELTKMGGAAGKIDHLEKRLANAEMRLKMMRRSADDASGSLSKIFGGNLIAQIGSVAAGYFSISTAVDAIVRGHEMWRQGLIEISAAAYDAATAFKTFVDLQAGGTKAKRVDDVMDLANKYGVKDLGAAFNATQALQSAVGQANPSMSEADKYAAGLKATAAVFAANRLGIPIDEALELEIQGAGQGAAPGHFTRMAYVAGNESARDPKQLAKAAPGLSFFADKEFGFAAAAVISGNVAPDELPTYLKSAGVGLSGVSHGKEWFRAQGLGDDATQAQRLALLAKRGIDTPEELDAIGIKEILQQKAISSLVTNEKAVFGIEKTIEEKAANVRLIESQVAANEAEVPTLQKQRLIDELESQHKTINTTGPVAEEAMDLQIEEERRALAMKRLGIHSWAGMGAFSNAEKTRTSALGLDAIDAWAKTTTFGTKDFNTGLDEEETAIARKIWGKDDSLRMGLRDRVNVEMEQIRLEQERSAKAAGFTNGGDSGLKQAADALQQSAKALNQAANALQVKATKEGRQTLGSPDQETPTSPRKP